MSLTRSFVPLRLLVVWSLAFFWLVTGCQPLGLATEVPATAVATLPLPTPSAIATLPESLPTVTPEPLPPTEPVSSPAEYQDLAVKRIYVHPVPVQYIGDQLTVQVVADVPPLVDPTAVEVQLWLDGELIGQNRLGGRNFAGENTAVFPWVWDSTTSLGEHTLEIRLDPQDQIQSGDENPANNSFTQPITLLPRGQRPIAENNWQWVTSETDLAYIHVVQGTAAHRDLDYLRQLTDEAITHSANQLLINPERKLDVYFINRVIGQGGYAGSSLVVSYPDRNYAGTGLWEVLVHEVVHLLDQRIAPRRLPFLAEGVAVWASGGHYKPENLHTRMAALQELGLFIPLTELANNFYPQQHEIGYLQSAGLISYLVDQYGWSAVRDFYASVEAVPNQTDAQVLDTQLQSHFGITLPQLEEQWRTFLLNQPYDAQAIPDLQTTVRYYEVMRRYQQTHDPTAYFMTAWLPFPQEMRQRQITTDLTRHPNAEINIVLETMLLAADSAFRAGDYQRANVIVNSVERVLETGSIIDPLAASYREIVHKAAQAGYEVQRIEMDGDVAQVLATQAGRPTLVSLNFSRTPSAWVLMR